MSMPTIHLTDQYFQPKIDLIQHLIQYSQNILLITAPAGGGKSAFAQFCLSHSTPQLKKHLLVITPTLSIETIMENIAKGFGMSWPQNGPLSSEAVQKIWTLFVDDAHLLSSDMLEALVRLVNFHQEPRRQLHLILLGEDKVVEQFSSNRITNLVGSYSTLIELGLPTYWQKNISQIFSEPVLVKADTPAFDSAALQKTAAPKTFAPPEFGSTTSSDFEDPITETDIDLLDDFSDTWPQAQSKKQSAPASDYKYIFSHPVAYGLYLGAILGVGLWSWHGGKEAPQYMSEAAQDMIAASEPTAVPAVKPRKKFAYTAPVEPSISEPEIQVSELSDDDYMNMPTAPVAQSKADLEQAYAPKPVPKVAKNKNITHLTMSQHTTQAHLTPKTQKPAKHAPKQFVSKITEPHKVVEKSILAKNKHHYTVQLYGSNDAQKVAHFKTSHGLDKAWVVKKQHEGKTWHVLVMGDYPTKIQAERATRQLPESLHHAKIKPWVREFAGLQNEIANSQKNG